MQNFDFQANTPDIMVNTFGHLVEAQHDSTANRNWVSTKFLSKLEPYPEMASVKSRTIMTLVDGTNVIVAGYVLLSGMLTLNGQRQAFLDKFYFLENTGSASEVCFNLASRLGHEGVDLIMGKPLFRDLQDNYEARVLANESSDEDSSHDSGHDEFD